MDDDDKIRRNLMVTSAVIIGVAWFDVSLPDVLERLFSIKQQAGTPENVVQLSNWKVWLAALAVLGYMSWRYRWSDEMEVAKKLFEESRFKRYQVLFHSVYMVEVVTWFRRGELPADVHPKMIATYAQVLPEALVKQLGRRPDKVLHLGRPPESMTLDGIPTTIYTIWEAETGAAHSQQQAVHIFIDEKRQRALFNSAWRYVIVNSKASMSLVWPVLIAASATLIVLYKLGRAILG